MYEEEEENPLQQTSKHPNIQTSNKKKLDLDLLLPFTCV
jgi:hypothetical protein